MAFISETLALWYFDQTLYDAVANNNFVLNNEDPYSAGEPVTGNFATFSRFNIFENQYKTIYGLDFSNNVSYEAELDTYTTGSFATGFWLKTTTALGFVRHAVTRAKEPRTAPVFAKAERAIVLNQEYLDMAVFTIIEEAQTDTTNALVLLLSEDGTTVANRITSAAYSPGVHHCLVTYDSGNSRARIDVDGYFGTWQAAPSSLNASVSTLKLNSINPNYTAHQASSRSTVIRDLYLKNVASTDETEGIRNTTFGVDYVTDLSLNDVEFANFGFSFAQPNTIATNAIVVNGSNIYFGRSNGDLLKGEQPIWDNEVVFDSDKKNELLRTTDVGTVEYTDDGVVLVGSFVTI